MKSRIKLNASMLDILMSMSGGNPGAASVLTQLIDKGASIDPDDFMGGIGSVLMLDTLEIYESRIWMLYKDVCGQSLPAVVAVLRAYQLGQLAGCTQKAINHAIDNNGSGLDNEKIMKAVQEQLPRFNKVQKPEQQLA